MPYNLPITKLSKQRSMDDDGQHENCTLAVPIPTIEIRLTNFYITTNKYELGQFISVLSNNVVY